MWFISLMCMVEYTQILVCSTSRSQCCMLQCSVRHVYLIETQHAFLIIKGKWKSQDDALQSANDIVDFIDLITWLNINAAWESPHLHIIMTKSPFNLITKNFFKGRSDPLNQNVDQLILRKGLLQSQYFIIISIWTKDVVGLLNML